MIIAIHQPQFMPWLGYFDKLDQADVFVLLDNVQYKKNEWQNRNRIKTPQGWQWLTVPVAYSFPEKINEVGISNNGDWREKHRRSLMTSYARAKFFSQISETLQGLYSTACETIASLNIMVVRELARLLGIRTPIHVASELGVFPDDPDERLIAIAAHFNATTYLAGSGGRDYMNLDKFRAAGLAVRFQEFHHPVYPQLFGPFTPNLSVLDLLFNCGPQSLAIIRGES